MNKLKSIGLLIGTSSFLILSPTIVKAQNSQSFSECVISLYNGPYNSSNAAEHCLQAFQGKSIKEDFSTCVDRLYEGPYSSSRAVKYCQQAMSNSPSQAEKSGTIIVIPNEQQRNQEPQRQEPQREAHRQCINTTFNTVWNDIHCQYNNPQFKWRTVYY